MLALCASDVSLQDRPRGDEVVCRREVNGNRRKWENVAASGQKGTKTRFSGEGKEDLEFGEVSYALRKPYEIWIFRIVMGGQGFK